MNFKIEQYILVLSLFAITILAKASNSIFETTSSNFPQHLKNAQFSIVNFYSHSCGHCKRLKPRWEYLSQLYPLDPTNNNNRKLQFLQVDSLSHKQLAEHYGIRSFPTIKLLNDQGQEVAQFNGFRTVDNLNRFVLMHTGLAPTWPDSHVVELRDVQEESGFTGYVKENALQISNGQHSDGNDSDKNYSADGIAEEEENIILKETSIAFSQGSKVQKFWEFIIDQYTNTDNAIVLSFVAPWISSWNEENSFYLRLATENFLNKNNKKAVLATVDITLPQNSNLVSLFKVNELPVIFHLLRNQANEKAKPSNLAKITENAIKLGNGFLQNTLALISGNHNTTDNNLGVFSKQNVDKFIKDARFQIYNRHDLSLVFPGDENDLVFKIIENEFVPFKTNHTMLDIIQNKLVLNEGTEAEVLQSGSGNIKMNIAGLDGSKKDIIEEFIDDVEFERDYLKLREL